MPEVRRAAVIQPTLEGRCSFATAGSIALFPPELDLERLLAVRLTLVASRLHPLAQLAEAISPEQLAEHIQLVLTDRSSLSDGKQFGVLAAKTWRIADLGAKHAFLKAGLGWGSMPTWMIKADLAAGSLVELNVDQGVWPQGNQMPMQCVCVCAVHRIGRASRPGGTLADRTPARPGTALRRAGRNRVPDRLTTQAGDIPLVRRCKARDRAF
ncbi:substrate-binding domain-containing protein [Rhizobium grahamii]|uniref:LysR family transcriptional regulator n=1 Tax=Rhizobium grahamii CCGE 502 TaxID=990285 RepID=S3I3Q4_9HYPH|nr:substrate-binding domain-containing protein [Rhizobium grahamii]EPE94263.1 LysR family transcriptional regulator [Rhizobium grahamii CCGE 502]